MAFGSGVALEYYLRDSQWNFHIVLVGVLLVFLGSIYGTVLGLFFIWWSLHRGPRKQKLPSDLSSEVGL